MPEDKIAHDERLWVDGHPYPYDQIALRTDGDRHTLECRATFGVGNTYVATYDAEGRRMTEVYSYANQEINAEIVPYIKKLSKAYDHSVGGEHVQS